MFGSLSHKPYNDTYASISTPSLKRHVNFIFFFKCTHLLQTSPGVANSCLWATLGPPPALVNKVLLECCITHLRGIFLLSRSDGRGAKDSAWPTKPKIVTILPFTESFQTTTLSII